MSISRREFVAGLAVIVPTLGSGSALAGATGSAAPAESAGLGAAKALQSATFRPLLGTSFRVGSPDTGETDLWLTNVDDFAAPKLRSGFVPTEGFSLIFSGDPASALPQRTYTVSHPKIGTFDAFVVPVGQAEKSTTYEIVFNRLSSIR